MVGTKIEFSLINIQMLVSKWCPLRHSAKVNGCFGYGNDDRIKDNNRKLSYIKPHSFRSIQFIHLVSFTIPLNAEVRILDIHIATI